MLALEITDGSFEPRNTAAWISRSWKNRRVEEEEEEEEEEESSFQIKANTELSHDCLDGWGLCCAVCLYMQSVKADNNKHDRDLLLSGCAR